MCAGSEPVGCEPPAVTIPEGPKTIPDDAGTDTGTSGGRDEPAGPCSVGVAVGGMIIGGTPPLDDPGLGTMEGSLPLDEIGSGLGKTGTSVVKVVWAFETVVCVDEGGTSAESPPATALEIAPAGFVTGTSVVKVVCEFTIVTGRDITGAAPLETPANAVEMAPAGLLMGTLAVIVVSD